VENWVKKLDKHSTRTENGVHKFVECKTGRKIAGAESWHRPQSEIPIQYGIC